MSYVSICAKLNLDPMTGHTPVSKIQKQIQRENARKKIKEQYDKGTTFGGTLHLTKEQWDKGMALSHKYRNMSAW